MWTVRWWDHGLTASSNGSYNWRDSSFDIPSSFTANKSSITVKVVFVSAGVDWNEFHYWAWSRVNGTTNLTDTLDVGDTTSENSHHYTINTQTWTGTRTFEYPPAVPAQGMADLLTNLWLRISYSGETAPSVFAPVGSFFAMGQFASYFTRALPVGLDAEQNLYCYFPMPFARHATVELVSHRQMATANIIASSISAIQRFLRQRRLF